MIIPKITEKIEVIYNNVEGNVYASCSTDNIITIHDSCSSFECQFDISQLEKVMDVLNMVGNDWEDNDYEYNEEDFMFSPAKIKDYFGEDVQLIEYNYIMRSRAYILYNALETLKDKLNGNAENIDIKSVDKKELLTFSVECLRNILDKINTETNHSDSSSKDRKENVS